VAKVIAVIDDETEMEYLYSLLLERQITKGLVELKFFSNSLHFAEWFKANTPDLILSDINMPQLDGEAIMQMIKQSNRRIPTYFVSGYDEREFKKIMQELGVYRFISKPLNFNHVLSLIELDLGILAANL